MPLEISIDCQVIIHMLTHDHPSHSSILHDCKDLLIQLGNPPVKHDFHERNQVADLLSKEGVRLRKANYLI